MFRKRQCRNPLQRGQAVYEQGLQPLHLRSRPFLPPLTEIEIHLCRRTVIWWINGAPPPNNEWKAVIPR